MSMLRDYISSKFSKTTSKSGPDRVHYAELGAKGTNNEVVAPDHNKFNANEVASLYVQSPYVYSCVKLIASALCSVPLTLYTKNRGGAVSKKTTGPVYDMLNFINKDMTQVQLMEYTASWYAMFGNMYWGIEDTPDDYADQSKFSIYPLNPRFVKIVADPETKQRAYYYEVGGKRIYYPENRIVAFNNFSPIDYWVGNAPVNALAYDIQIERFMKRQLRNKFFNGSVVDSVLTVEEALDDAEIIKMKREFREQHSGTANAGRLLIITKGMEFDRLEEVNSDPNASALMDNVLNSHAMVLGVPTVLLKMSGAGANDIKEAKALFWENTIVPLARVIQEIITKKLCAPVSSNLYTAFDFSNVYALRINDLDRARVEIAHINAGVKSVDEVRTERGLEPKNTPYSSSLAPEWMASNTERLQQLGAASRGTPNGAGSASPSLPNGGSEGGRRNQSANGEAGMLDSTGKRSVNTDEALMKMALEELGLGSIFEVMPYEET